MTPEKDDPIDTENVDDSQKTESEPLAENAADKVDDVSVAQNDEGSVSVDSAEQSEAVDDDPLGFGSSRMSEATEDDEINDLREQLAAATAKADEHWERLLLMQADMENQRKRSAREVSNARKFALEGVVNDLLPVKDSLEMGITAAQQEDAAIEKIIEGSELTLKMLAQAFEKYNIIEIDPVDMKFDPEFHQAMSMQEIEGREPNTVASVLQKGYTLNERLIRPALVMVAK
jgi:molecular chaperone GrpE